MAKHAKHRTAAKTGAASWWLDSGEENCPHCDHTYFYEGEVRCFECDAPICPMCIVRVEALTLCPACRETGKTH